MPAGNTELVAGKAQARQEGWSSPSSEELPLFRDVI